MRKALLWFWLAVKRLLKKPLYLVLLLLMPALTVLYTRAVSQSDGVVSIVLAVDAQADEMTRSVVEQLTEEKGLIHFSFASKEEARSLVEAGDADAAWIFPKDLAAQLAKFVADWETPEVTVLQRQDTVLLRLSREKLSGVLYDRCAEPVYLAYLRQQVPQLAHLEDGQLVAYMAWFRGNERLFDFVQTDGTPVSSGAYLLSPLRGLFGVLILLCALSAGMYFLHDEAEGAFGKIPVHARGIVEFGSQLAALLGVVLAATVCMALSGSWAGLWRELAAAVLYLLCCAAFGCLLRRMCRKVSVLAGLMPVLTVAALVVCPVFADLSELGAVRYLLPVTYYIRAQYSDRALLMMVGYALVCGAVSACMDALGRYRGGRKAVRQ